MALLIDEIKNFPQACLKTKSGKDVWVVAKSSYLKPLKWRIIDSWGVLIGRYEAFRYLSQDEMSHYESISDMKQKEVKR